MEATIRMEDDPEVWAQGLEGLIAINKGYYTSGIAENLPPLYRSGVVYRPEKNSEKWLTAKQVFVQGHGDCEDLTAIRVSELRTSGYDPGAKAHIYQTGPKRWHAVVELSDGSIEDPTKILKRLEKERTRTQPEPTESLQSLVGNGPSATELEEMAMSQEQEELGYWADPNQWTDQYGQPRARYAELYGGYGGQDVYGGYGEYPGFQGYAGYGQPGWADASQWADPYGQFQDPYGQYYGGYAGGAYGGYDPQGEARQARQAEQAVQAQQARQAELDRATEQAQAQIDAQYQRAQQEIEAEREKQERLREQRAAERTRLRAARAEAKKQRGLAARRQRAAQRKRQRTAQRARERQRARPPRRKWYQ